MDTSAEALAFLALRKQSKSAADTDDYVLARSMGYCELCGYAKRHLSVVTSKNRENGAYRKAAGCNSCRLSPPPVPNRFHNIENSIDSNRLKVVTCALIFDEQGRVLVAKRRHFTSVDRPWEFPGGKVENGESLSQCLERELLEELGMSVAPPSPFVMVDHSYDDFDIRLCALVTRPTTRIISTSVHSRVLWLPVHELDKTGLAAADALVAQALVRKPPKLD